MLSSKTIKMSIAALLHECRTDDVIVTDWSEEKNFWGERISNLERYEPYRAAIKELEIELKLSEEMEQRIAYFMEFIEKSKKDNIKD